MIVQMDLDQSVVVESDHWDDEKNMLHCQKINGRKTYNSALASALLRFDCAGTCLKGFIHEYKHWERMLQGEERVIRWNDFKHSSTKVWWTNI